ncbi:MAG: cytochrome c3 family protein [Halodesulfurarchaeum sp.]
MTGRAILLVTIAGAVLLIAALPSVAGVAADDNGSTFASPDPVGQAQQVECSDCHQPSTPMANGGPRNSATCAKCHEVARAFEQSVHANSETLDLTCVDCHDAPEDGWFMHFRSGPHGDQNPSVPMAPEGTCTLSGCHGYGSEAEIPPGKSTGVTHVNKQHPEYGEWNETEDPSWNSSMVSHSKPAPRVTRNTECMPCHGTHEGVFANIEKAPGVYEYARKAQPNPANVTEWRITCVVCHDPHTIRPEDVLRGDFADGSKLCAQCHNAELGARLQAGEQTEVHHSMWEMYSRSKFVDNGSSHVELDCYTCHMAGLYRPPGSVGTSSGPARYTGHDFDVNSSRLMSERLRIRDFRDCSRCHQSLSATMSEQKRLIRLQVALAADMRAEANQTMTRFGLRENQTIRSTYREGTFWLNFVEAAGSGLHNPEMATNRLRGAIERFDMVKSMAYTTKIARLQRKLEAARQATTTATPTPTPTATPAETPTTTKTTTPGLGVAAALIGLFGAAMLIRRQSAG